MRGRLAYRGPDPDDVRGIRGNGREGGARPQVRREASFDAFHATRGHLRTRAFDSGQGRARGAGSERRFRIPPGNRLHRRSAPARGRLGTRDRTEEDQGLAGERVAHNRAGLVHPPRFAGKDLPHPDQLIASCQFVMPSSTSSSPLPPDAKTAEFSLRIGPRHLDRFDPCVGLGRLVPLDARLNHGPIAFEDRLHTSIPSVLDVPVKSQRLRLLRTIRSKVDPLHASEKHDDRADFHLEAKRDDEKELYRGDWRFERRCPEPLERRIQNPSIASDRTSNAPGRSSDGILSAFRRNESDPGCRGITNDGRRSSWHAPRMRSTWERVAANCWQNFATRTADVRSPRSRGP